MSKARAIVCGAVAVMVFCLQSKSLAQILPRPATEDSPAEAWYNPNNGRFTVSVYDVDAWFIRTVPERAQYFKGPPFDPVTVGILPASSGGFGGATRWQVTEANLVQFSYGPLDLGMIAEPNRSTIDFEMGYVRLSQTQRMGRVYFVPEVSSGLLVFMASCASRCLRV